MVTEIEARSGTFSRSVEKEAGIFKSFATRWGALAPRIARYAFEVLDGTWNNEVITIHRFCKGSDPFFAQVIADRLIAHDAVR